MNGFEEENDEAPSNGVDQDENAPGAVVHHLVAAAQAGFLGGNAQEIALEFGEEKAAPGAALVTAPVAAVATTANSNADSGATNAGAAVSMKAIRADTDAIVEVEEYEDIEYVPDDQLAVAEYRKITLISKPKVSASLKAKEERKESPVHKEPIQ